MKVLIDENLPRKLAGHLKGHECRTVAECGWAGKKNGELLSLAEDQFDVLLTLDKIAHRIRLLRVRVHLQEATQALDLKELGIKGECGGDAEKWLAGTGWCLP